MTEEKLKELAAKMFARVDQEARFDIDAAQEAADYLRETAEAVLLEAREISAVARDEGSAEYEETVDDLAECVRYIPAHFELVK